MRRCSNRKEKRDEKLMLSDSASKRASERGRGKSGRREEREGNIGKSICDQIIGDENWSVFLRPIFNYLVSCYKKKLDGSLSL